MSVDPLPALLESTDALPCCLKLTNPSLIVLTYNFLIFHKCIILTQFNRVEDSRLCICEQVNEGFIVSLYSAPSKPALGATRELFQSFNITDLESGEIYTYIIYI